MAAKEVTPNRSNLLEVKKKIKLSKSGHKIMKMKRDGLIMEFFEILEKAKGVRERVVKDYEEGMHKIAIARAVEGAIPLQSAAFALNVEIKIELRSKSIMGLAVPEIEATSVKTPIDKRGYGVIGISPYIDEAVKAFENLVETIALAAEIETTMKKLLDEIEKTKRRVNALEFKVIPELEEAERFISFRLEEMERDAIFSLKIIKKKGEAAN